MDFNFNSTKHRNSMHTLTPNKNGVLWLMFHEAPWLSLIDAKTGTQIRRIRLKTPATAIKASPSGQFVAVISRNSPRVLIFSSQDQTLMHTLNLEGPAQTLGFTEEALWVSYTTPNAQTKIVAFSSNLTGAVQSSNWTPIQNLTLPASINQFRAIPDLNQVWLTTSNNLLLSLQKNDETDLWQLGETHHLNEWGDNPVSMDWNQSEQIGLIAMAYSNEVVMTDHEFNIKHKLYTAEAPSVVKLDANDNAIWVLANRGQVLQEFEFETQELVKEIAIGQGCSDMVQTPWHGWAIVCKHSKNIWWVHPNQQTTHQTALPDEPSGLILTD